MHSDGWDTQINVYTPRQIGSNAYKKEKEESVPPNRKLPNSYEQDRKPHLHGNSQNAPKGRPTWGMHDAALLLLEEEAPTVVALAPKGTRLPPCCDDGCRRCW